MSGWEQGSEDGSDVFSLDNWEDGFAIKTGNTQEGRGLSWSKDDEFRNKLRCLWNI